MHFFTMDNLEAKSEYIEIQPFKYKGELCAPASKSYLQRAIAIASLSEKPCLIKNFYPSKDALAALNIAENLGAEIEQYQFGIKINRGQKVSESVVLNCGESGLSTRMFSPIAALFDADITVTGTGSLMQRPIAMIEDALQQLGIKTNSNGGFLPLHFRGGIQGSTLMIDGSESSQLLTGLLIALPLLDTDSELLVNNLKSIPYIQMTLDILTDFGIKIQHDNFQRFHISGGQKPHAKSYSVEGDWSGAAFHAVGAAISGEILLHGLNLQSAQADKAILQALERCGANVEFGTNSVRITKAKLHSFDFDATHCPDLFPPLAVLAACCDGITNIHGVSRLKNKESDRAKTIQSEFEKLNIPVRLEGDVMKISKSSVTGGVVDSNNDHRIAMASAILASVSDSKIKINQSKAVEKSYPTFFEDLKSVSMRENN